MTDRLKLKGCSRCGGDMYQDPDETTCLQCGYVTYPVRVEELPEWLRRDSEPVVYNGSRSGHPKYD